MQTFSHHTSNRRWATVPGRALLVGVLCALPLPGNTQAPAPPHQATCSIDNAPPSDADIAFGKRDIKKAATLYQQAFDKNEQDGHAHSRSIEILIDQGKFDDASKKLDLWIADKPSDPWALITSARLRFSRGQWLEAYAFMLKALKLDPCQPIAYAGLAEFESAYGYRLAARKHLVLARQLAPLNRDIRLQWINSLPDEQRLDELQKFIEQSKSASDAERKSLITTIQHQRAALKDHCELASFNGPARIPMVPMYLPDSNAIQFYGLEVSINGHRRTLQLDTGASGVLLSHSAIFATGLTPIDAANVGGFGSQSTSGTTIALAASIRIGGLEFKDCIVDELNNFGVMGGSFLEGNRLDNTDGLIGSDIFSRYLVTLDYIKHEIRLEPLPTLPGPPPGPTDALGGSNTQDWCGLDRYTPPSMKSWTRIYRIQHLIYMPSIINSEVPALFVIDTGSFSNLIDFSTAKQVTKAQEGGAYSISGLSGSSALSEAGSFTLDFAGLRLPIRSMDSVDLTSFGAQGFLGYPTLQQLVMHIDYRDDLVLFEAPVAAKLPAKK